MSDTLPASQRGYFDVLRDAVATGWAFSSLHPSQRQLVEIVEGERVVARGLADQFRQDLAPAGIGDGQHCFRLRVSFELCDGADHVLHARFAGSGHVLAGGSHVLNMAQDRHGDYELMDASATAQIAAYLASLTQPHAAGPPAQAAPLTLAVTAAQLALEMLELDNALAQFEQLRLRYGHPAIFLCKEAECHLLGGRHAQAAAAYLAATQSKPDFTWAWLGYGNALRLDARWCEAEAAYLRGIALSPQAAQLRARLASVRRPAQMARAGELAGQGRFDDAIGQLADLLRSYPDDLDAARLYRKMQLGKARAPADAQPAAPFLQDLDLVQLSLEILLDAAEARLEKRA